MPVDPKLLEHLAAFDTPTICNALEVVAPQRRGHGYTSKPFVCAFQALKPIVGYRPHGDDPRPRAVQRARRPRPRRSGWPTTSYVAAQPMPTIVVIQDLDPEPGYGAFWGEVNTAVHKGLGVLGCITNGSIRDLDMIATDFQLLAGCVGPSHAFVHLERLRRRRSTVHGMAVTPWRPDPCRPAWRGGHPGRRCRAPPGRDRPLHPQGGADPPRPAPRASRSRTCAPPWRRPTTSTEQPRRGLRGPDCYKLSWSSGAGRRSGFRAGRSRPHRE